MAFRRRPSIGGSNNARATFVPKPVPLIDSEALTTVIPLSLAGVSQSLNTNQTNITTPRPPSQPQTSRSQVGSSPRMPLIKADPRKPPRFSVATQTNPTGGKHGRATTDFNDIPRTTGMRQHKCPHCSKSADIINPIYASEIDKYVDLSRRRQLGLEANFLGRLPETKNEADPSLLTLISGNSVIPPSESYQSTPISSSESAPQQGQQTSASNGTQNVADRESSKKELNYDPYAEQPELVETRKLFDKIFSNLSIPPPSIPANMQLLDDAVMVTGRPPYDQIEFDERKKKCKGIKFPTTPSNRGEVIMLMRVLQNMLKDVDDPIESFQQVQELQHVNVVHPFQREFHVWNIVLIELVRQVHANCSDRGFLLELSRRKLLQMFSFLMTTVTKLQETCVDLEDGKAFDPSSNFKASRAHLPDSPDNMQSHVDEQKLYILKLEKRIETLMKERDYAQSNRTEKQGESSDSSSNITSLVSAALTERAKQDTILSSSAKHDKGLRRLNEKDEGSIPASDVSISVPTPSRKTSLSVENSKKVGLMAPTSPRLAPQPAPPKTENTVEDITDYSRLVSRLVSEEGLAFLESLVDGTIDESKIVKELILKVMDLYDRLAFIDLTANGALAVNDYKYGMVELDPTFISIVKAEIEKEKAFRIMEMSKIGNYVPGQRFYMKGTLKVIDFESLMKDGRSAIRWPSVGRWTILVETVRHHRDRSNSRMTGKKVTSADKGIQTTKKLQDGSSDKLRKKRNASILGGEDSNLASLEEDDDDDDDGNVVRQQRPGSSALLNHRLGDETEFISKTPRPSLQKHITPLIARIKGYLIQCKDESLKELAEDVEFMEVKCHNRRWIRGQLKELFAYARTLYSTSKEVQPFARIFILFLENAIYAKKGAIESVSRDIISWVATAVNYRKIDAYCDIFLKMTDGQWQISVTRIYMQTLDLVDTIKVGFNYRLPNPEAVITDRYVCLSRCLVIAKTIYMNRNPEADKRLGDRLKRRAIPSTPQDHQNGIPSGAFKIACFDLLFLMCYEQWQIDLAFTRNIRRTFLEYNHSDGLLEEEDFMHLMKEIHPTGSKTTFENIWRIARANTVLPTEHEIDEVGFIAGATFPPYLDEPKSSFTKTFTPDYDYDEEINLNYLGMVLSVDHQSRILACVKESWESIVGLLNTYLRQDLISMDYRLQSLYQIRQKLEDYLNRKREGFRAFLTYRRLLSGLGRLFLEDCSDLCGFELLDTRVHSGNRGSMGGELTQTLGTLFNSYRVENDLRRLKHLVMLIMTSKLEFRKNHADSFGYQLRTEERKRDFAVDMSQRILREFIRRQSKKAEEEFLKSNPEAAARLAKEAAKMNQTPPGAAQKAGDRKKSQSKMKKTPPGTDDVSQRSMMVYLHRYLGLIPEPVTKTLRRHSLPL